jgi:molybdate transport system ATP-binding protein
LNEVTVSLAGKTILNKLSFQIHEKQHLGICGPSGSGKSILAKVISGDIFCRGDLLFLDSNESTITPKITRVEQQHRFKNRSNVSNFYYQQRYNSTDNEDSLTVGEELDQHGISMDMSWIRVFNIEELVAKPMIQLSNGENKRLQLVKALSSSPDILILDNPFLGLDEEGRKTLSESINSIAASGIKIILIASPEDFPSCISHMVWLENNLAQFIPVDEYSRIKEHSNEEIQNEFQNLPFSFDSISKSLDPIIEIKNLHIQYGDQIILENINWTVLRGERWCVTGPNGSGKSTLLSLITADNPQGYANEIYLFGKKRGSGESIWEIKSKIGYVSPELHLYFEQGFTCKEVVASGLFDTIGLFRKLNKEQEVQVLKWMDIMGISNIQDKYIHQLSLGQQRWIMLTRALIKNPELLILDEPCQGLDRIQTNRFVALIDSLCSRTNTTLIYVSHYTEDIPNSITHRLQLAKGRRSD